MTLVQKLVRVYPAGGMVCPFIELQFVPHKINRSNLRASTLCGNMYPTFRVMHVLSY